MALVYLTGMLIEIDIAHVARLARLGLEEDALARYGSQLEVILEHAVSLARGHRLGWFPSPSPGTPPRGGGSIGG